MFIWWIVFSIGAIFTVTEIVSSNIIYRLKELSRKTKVIFGSIGFLNNFILIPIIVIIINVNFRSNQVVNIIIASLLIINILFFIIEKVFLKKDSTIKKLISYFTKYFFNILPITTIIYFLILLV